MKGRFLFILFFLERGRSLKIVFFSLLLFAQWCVCRDMFCWQLLYIGFCVPWAGTNKNEMKWNGRCFLLLIILIDLECVCICVSVWVERCLVSDISNNFQLLRCTDCLTHWLKNWLHAQNFEQQLRDRNQPIFHPCPPLCFPGRTLHQANGSLSHSMCVKIMGIALVNSPLISASISPSLHLLLSLNTCISFNKTYLGSEKTKHFLSNWE